MIPPAAATTVKAMAVDRRATRSASYRMGGASPQNPGRRHYRAPQRCGYRAPRATLPSVPTSGAMPLVVGQLDERLASLAVARRTVS